jgi:2-dehydro-3-deoxyphosphogluconate aldolase/(4S)-4-hydroxy-2-oxoglutarate aldolase
MAKYSRLKVLTTIIETGMVPVYYHFNIEVVTKVILACIEGGARVFEFTNRGDQADEVFCELIKRFRSDDRIILGVGSILDPATSALYIQSGANFIVGPVFNPQVALLCNRHKIAYIPGCGSVSEISQAEESGAEICKIFPGSAVGGPGFVKDLLGPMPWSRLMPTGGVDTTEESISNWFNAGVASVGIGSKLFPADVVASGNDALISEKVRQVLFWIKKVRNNKPPIQ